MADYDFVVLGSGPAGRRAAVQAAKLGKRVLVVDDRARVGGVSVHTGTIPSKTLRETVLNLSGWRERGFYGQSYRVKHDICPADLTQRMAKTLDHEISVLEHQFARNGIRVACASGRFLDAHTLALASDGGEERVGADKVLIATGTAPFHPPEIPVQRRKRARQRRIHRQPARAQEPDRRRRRGHRARIRDDLLRARRAGDADRTARDAARLHRPRGGRSFHLPDARSRHDLAARRGGGESARSGERLAGLRACRRPAGVERDRPVHRRPHRRHRRAEPARLRPGGRFARAPDGGSGDLPDLRAAHLRRRRRHRLPQPRRDFDGTGPHRRLPCLRRVAARRRPGLPFRHLRGARAVLRRPRRRAGESAAASPTNAASHGCAKPRAGTSWAFPRAC